MYIFICNIYILIVLYVVLLTLHVTYKTGQIIKATFDTIYCLHQVYRDANISTG